MIKKILIITAVIVTLAIAAVFYYQYQIISYSAEKIIRGALPGYIKIAKMRFDIKDKRAFLEGFVLEGPSGFSDRYPVEIAEISCRYKLKGATILDGLEIFEPVLKGVVLHIERLKDGRVNLTEMGSVIKSGAEGGGSPKPEAGPPQQTQQAQETQQAPQESQKPEGNKNSEPKATDFIKIPQEFKIKNGSIIFTDRFFVSGYNVMTLNNIEAGLILRMNDSYSQILDVASTGEGNINGYRDQRVKWAIKLNPNTPKLTMSSRFDISGVDLIAFEPYYDRFSPFEFAKCRVSGVLIFNFDNGNIGSTNELHLRDLLFSVKPSAANGAMFDTNVQDLTRYFTTISGDVIFDFKIKGDMANPRFFLGPIAKQAVAAIIMDKVGDVLQQMSRKGSDAANSVAGASGNTDIDNAINMFKGFLDKKN